MGTWRCAFCDTYNPDTVDACMTCGRSRRGDEEVVDGRPPDQQVPCPVCRGTNPPGRSRCQWCGAELPLVMASVPAPSAGSAGAQAMVSGAEAGGGGAPFDLPEDFLDGEPEPTVQTKPPRPKTRPCATCGVMLEPDEWVLVAGPRILCRACFHEEFGSKRRDSGQAPKEDEPDSTTDGEAEPLAPVHRGRALAFAVWAAGLGAVGGVVTWLVGLTWGLTPLGAGLVLAGLAWWEWRRHGPRGTARAPAG